MKILKIAMVTLFYPPAFSGAGYQAQCLVRALKDLGVDVEVLTVSKHSDTGDVYQSDLEISVHRISSSLKIFGSRSLVFSIRAAWWLLRRNHWQILHIHAFSYWSLPMIAVALIKKRPIIVKSTLLGVDDIETLRTQPFGYLLAYAFRRVDAVIAISREIASTFESHGWLRSKVLQIPNGVDSGMFFPVSIYEKLRVRERLGISAGAFVILSVGAISRRKNMASVIEAAARADVPNPLVIIAGPDETYLDCHRELEQLAIDFEDRMEVRFTGVLNQSELADLYKASDAYTLLSFAEGLPNSVLEAMASGLPVIASDIPGCRDVVSRKTGILVSPTDIQAIADAISHLVCHSAAANQMGIAARNAVVDEYSITAIARRYSEVYESLIFPRA